MLQENRVVKTFLELVKVDSETKDERKICDHLKKRFQDFGLQVYEDDTTSETGHGAGNLIINFPASNPSTQVPAIYFTSHMDTVVPGKNINPVIQGDWIQTDGKTILGADDKAGIAAMLEAIEVIQEKKLAHGEIQFIITVGEESGLIGARALDSKQLTAKFGYALDSNGELGGIAVAAPTQAEIMIKIHGKSAHAGVNPEDGISAIQVASQAISAMRLGRIDFETTANIGRFEGGQATNIIPDFVKIEAEARSISHEKLEKQVQSMKQAVQSTVEKFGAVCEFETEIIYPSFCYTEQDLVVKVAQSAIEKSGLKPSTFHSGGGSDANIFNGIGVPTVNLSVGYEHIHTTQERIKISDLVKLSELVVKIVQEVEKN